MTPTPALDSYFPRLGSSDSERRLLAWITLASGVLALACMAVGLDAAHYDFDAFSEPSRLLDMSGVNPRSLRAFLLLDMFGFYLLLAPLVLASHRFLVGRTPWAATLTACGLAYVLIGSIGASILAAAWPSILEAHALASPAEALQLRANFSLFTQLVYDGLWNTLEVLLVGVWWSGLALALWSTNRAFAWLTLLTGIFPLLDGVAGLFAIAPLHEAMLTGYSVTSIVWPIALGTALLRSTSVRERFPALA
ncbi:MAG TPA: hypothetical protein VLC09_03025 [Polyangiaceae bacterium]|nr:hypothetical protein [Polyangiaceae bacterium]